MGCRQASLSKLLRLQSKEQEVNRKLVHKMLERISTYLSAVLNIAIREGHWSEFEVSIKQPFQSQELQLNEKHVY